MNIATRHINRTQYLNTPRVMTDISQIVLHHTCGSTADGAIASWNETPARIGTNYLIDRDGTVIEAIPLNRFAYHLYIPAPANRRVLDRKWLTSDHDFVMAKKTIGIELVGLGELTRKDGRWLDCYNRPFRGTDITQYATPFRGYSGFQSYTPAQIAALKNLIGWLWMNCVPHVPLTYNADMWNVSTDAVSGKPGIWTHVSYRIDKADCHPQPELIDMLKSLA